MTARVIHFEINAANPARAKTFYESVFGWKIEKWNGTRDYWLVMTGQKDRPGIDGGLLKRPGTDPDNSQPVNSFICIIEVENLDTMKKK